jgi:protein FRG1
MYYQLYLFIERRRESIILLIKKNANEPQLETKVFIVWICIQKPSTTNNTSIVWVRVDSLEDLIGPLFITHPSEPPVCLTVDEDDRFMAYPLPNLYDNNPEPIIMHQVFVGSRIVGSTDAFTLKSANGKYLSSDKFGVVECNSEAIGGQEEWRPTLTDAGVAFQSVHNKIMMIDEIAGGGMHGEYIHL